MPPSQLGKLTLLLASYLVAIQGLIDRIQQVLITEGFRQELNRTGLHRLDGHGDISITGDEDNGNPNTCICQFMLKLEAVGATESHVKNKATRSVRPLAAQELLRRFEGLGMEANRLQHALNRGTHQRIVINDEDRGCRCRLQSCPSGLVGERKVNAASVP